MAARKIKTAWIVIGIIAVVLVIVGVLSFNIIRSVIAITTMKPLDTGPVSGQVSAVKNDYVNFYLYKSGDKYIVFDAGADQGVAQKALEDLGIDPADVAAVFLTHTDGDHVTALPLFTSAQVYMGESNRAFLEGKDGQSRSGVFLGMGLAVKTMQDQETVLVAGVSVQCLYTPGHTAGSVCYLVDGKYLFVGDTLNLKDGKAVLFNDVFNMDNDVQAESIRRLSGLAGVEAVFTMHTGYSVDPKAAFAGW